jgi:hypothetical protein
MKNFLNLRKVVATLINNLTLAKATVGFTIAGGDTSKTLTVNGDATVSGTNTGDQDLTGKKNHHGVESIDSVSFNNTSHALTIATIKYWFLGTSFTGTSVTCDIDDTLTLTTNTLYYFYFDDASGTLKVNSSGLNLYTQVPVALVMWNGSAGAVMAEWHSHTRDLGWHINAHLTIGARYYSGLALTTPTTSVDDALSISGGTIYDEDLVISISNPQISMRGWYKASASVYTFANYSLPYVGTSGQPQYLDTDTYTLTNVAASDFVCMWVYASNDITVPIYVIPTHAASVYNIISGARTEAPPSLAGLNISPEMKLLYKFIYKGDGQFQESVDYRTSSSLPSGGTAATSASAVSFAPTGNVSSTDVQGAIAELDTEKAPALGTDDNYVTDAEKVKLSNLSGTNSGDQTDATLTFTDITTNNASTTKHGFLPKLPTPATGAFLKDDGTWAAAGGSLTITDDTSTNASHYPVLSTSASGSLGAVDVSSTKLFFNPSTGLLTATSFYGASDLNLKENIFTICNGLSVINQLSGIEFDWKENGIHSAGIGAQDLELVLPFLVNTAENGQKSVNYSGLSGYFISAIKELHIRQRVLELQHEHTVDNLLGMINDLKERISVLEGK